MARLKARKRVKRSHNGSLKARTDSSHPQSRSNDSAHTDSSRKGSSRISLMLALRSNRARSQRNISQPVSSSDASSSANSGSSPIRKSEPPKDTAARRTTYVSPSKYLNQPSQKNGTRETTHSGSETSVCSDESAHSASTRVGPDTKPSPHSSSRSSSRRCSAPPSSLVSSSSRSRSSSEMPKESPAVALNGDSDSGALSESSVSSFGSFGRRSLSPSTARTNPTLAQNTHSCSSHSYQKPHSTSSSSSSSCSSSKLVKSSAVTRSRLVSQPTRARTFSTTFSSPKSTKSPTLTRSRHVSQPTISGTPSSNTFPSPKPVRSPAPSRAHPLSYTRPSSTCSGPTLLKPIPPPPTRSRPASQPTSTINTANRDVDGANSDSPDSDDAEESAQSPASSASAASFWQGMGLSEEQKAAVAKSHEQLREKFAANMKKQKDNKLKDVLNAARLHVSGTITADEAEFMIDFCRGDELEVIKKLTESSAFLQSMREMLAQRDVLPSQDVRADSQMPSGSLGSLSDSDDESDDNIESPVRRHPRHVNKARRKLIAKQKKKNSRSKAPKKNRKKKRRQAGNDDDGDALMSDYDEYDDEEYSAADGDDEESDDESFDPAGARADLRSLTRSQNSDDSGSDSDDEYIESPKPKRRRQAPTKKNKEQKAREAAVATWEHRPGYKKDGSKRNKRLLLDDALNRDGFKGWSEARKKAYGKLLTSPNTYFYRFNLSGEEQGRAGWTKEESKKFMLRLEEGVSPDCGWGLFAFGIPRRVGYQCSAHYRDLVKVGKIRDPKFWMHEDGKLHYNKEGKAGYFSNAKNGKNQMGKCKVIPLPMRDDAFVVTEHTFKSRAETNEEVIKALKEMGVTSPEVAPTKPMPAAATTSSSSSSSSSSSASSSTPSSTSASSTSSSSSSPSAPVTGKATQPSKKRKRMRKQKKPARRRARVSDHEDDPSFHGSYRLSESEKKLEELCKSNPLPQFTDQITGEKMARPAISKYGHVLGYETWMTILNQEPKNVCPFTKQTLVRRQLTKLTSENWHEFKDKVRSKF